MPFPRLRPSSLAAASGLAVLCALGPALPAAAHVSVTPSTATPGQFLVYTVSVPNERDDQATVEVDLTLPVGFALDSAEQVAGWHTVVTRNPGGIPVQVAWRGGRIPVGTFAKFSLQGRNPATGKPLVWAATQRYQKVTVAWNGPESSAHPAAVVLLTGAAVGTSPAAPGAGTGGTASGVDLLARSRAALALVLAGAGLLMGLAIAAVSAARRRRPEQPDRQELAAPHPGAPGVDRSGRRPAATPGARPKEGGKVR